MRTTSTAARAALYAPESRVVFLSLLTIDHEEMAAPVRYVNDLVDIVSRGNTYTAFPINPPIPASVPGELQQVEFVVDNVTREMIATIRGISTPATITEEIILSTTPDTVEAGPWALDLIGAVYDAFQIKLTVASEALWSEPYPSGLMTPPLFPSLFKSVAR